jgi:hypothetical protein
LIFPSRVAAKQRDGYDLHPKNTGGPAPIGLLASKLLQPLHASRPRATVGSKRRCDSQGPILKGKELKHRP